MLDFAPVTDENCMRQTEKVFCYKDQSASGKGSVRWEIKDSTYKFCIVRNATWLSDPRHCPGVGR